MLNTEAIIHPKLHHCGLITGNLERSLQWYRTVLGMRPVHQSDTPTGAPANGPHPRAAFVSNDEMSHRIAIIELPDVEQDAQAAQKSRARYPRLQHIAFEYQTLDDLLGTYVRLREQGIVPVYPVDEGAQTAFYYVDPDRNGVELNVNNYTDRWAAIEHMQTIREFSKRPLGVEIDPDKLVEARLAGATPWDIHKRAWTGEFAPAVPPKLEAML